jgi:hypothetical protein
VQVQLLEKLSEHRLTSHETQVNEGLSGQLVSVPPC